MPPETSPTPKRTLSPALISIIVIAVLALGAAGVYALTHADTNSTTTEHQPTTTDTSDTTDPATASSSDSDATYTDGTYTETGSYSTPGGQESVTVTATLSDGTITSISATGSATSGESAERQSQFLSGYKSLVVGKSITAVQLSRVSGSSLTSNGFNAAIEKIKDDAEA